MANLMTHSMTFSKQSVQEFFLQPFFMGEDLRPMITVRTDIKGTEILNRITRPTKITKRKLVPGFTPNGSMTLTHKDITVKQVAVEFEQNGRAFLDSVLASALAKGYSEDDVASMSNPAFWDQVVLPMLAETTREDLIRQMFFADETKEVLTGGFITGGADTDHQVYTGFWTNFIKDAGSLVIPAAQKIAINNAAVKQEVVETLTGTTAGTITLTVNGTAYSKAWDTSIAATVTAWFVSYAAIIAARGLLTGIVITNPSAGVLKFVAAHAGQGFTCVETSAGTNGTWTPSGVVVNVAAAALTTDEADSTLEAMLDAMPPEMNAFNPVFMVTNSMFRNWVKTLKSKGTEQAHTAMINGVLTKTYEGYPIYVRPDWDKNILADHNSVYPHRATLAPMENLLFGCDGASDDEAIEAWYNLEAQMRRYRIQYKAQTLYLNKELIVLAY